MPEFINALMEYCNSEDKDRLSLAQRLFGRPIRTRLPTHPLVFDLPIYDEIGKSDKKARRLCKLPRLATTRAPENREYWRVLPVPG